MKKTAIAMLVIASLWYIMTACDKTAPCTCDSHSTGVCLSPSEQELVSVDENGITEDIYNIVPLYVFNMCKDWNVPVYTGNTPPNLEGTYFISPLILENSNIEDDMIGDQFLDAYITFSNQNNSTQTVDIEYQEGNSISKGIGHFIGTGDSFSVFVKSVTSDEHGHLSGSIDVYSGSLSSDGIQDFYESFVMTDDGGDPDDDLIENGEARFFYDSDGISERTTKPLGSLKSTGNHSLKAIHRK
jgi:hypothetical protein